MGATGTCGCDVKIVASIRIISGILSPLSLAAAEANNVRIKAPG